jgi:hypothetical protein
MIGLKSINTFNNKKAKFNLIKMTYSIAGLRLFQEKPDNISTTFLKIRIYE